MLNLVTRILNGVNFASYEFNNLVYKAQPIPHRQIVELNSISPNAIIPVDLTGVLDHALLVHSVDIDLNTSEDVLTGDEAGDRDNITSFLTLVVKNKINDSVIKRYIFQIDSTPNEIVNGLILSSAYKYELKTDRNVAALKFLGEPVHLLPTLSAIVDPLD